MAGETKTAMGVAMSALDRIADLDKRLEESEDADTVLTAAVSESAQDIRDIKVSLRELWTAVREIEEPEPDDMPDEPLPAPALTEDAIVAALRGDPNLMGRVIVKAAGGLSTDARSVVRQSANSCCEKSPDPDLSRVALQSLAVALSAASYRG